MKKNLINFSFLILISFSFFFNYLVLYFIISLFFFLKLYSKFSYFKILGACFFFSFFLFEIIIKKKTESNDFYIKTDMDYEINKDYGYHPKKNKVFKEKIYYKNKLIKENVYSINNYGHRNILNNKNLNKCILFHGGSVTFGQTLDDEENLPFLVKSILNKNFKVFNFAFNGYGPHQFLSKIENNYLAEIKDCKKLYVFYQFIPDHIGRVAGKRSWGDKSPRYQIKDEKLISDGFFTNFPYKIVMKLRKNFRSSRVINIFYQVDSTNNRDNQLFLKILLEIEKKLKQKFYNSVFIYILWDDMNGNDTSISSFFSGRDKINIEDLNIKEEYLKNGITGDNHPTKEFNIILANHITKFLENKR